MPLPLKPTLRQGSQGPAVVNLQHLLNLIPEALVAKLIEDGLFGRRTFERVAEFQRNAKLVVDGVVGPQSWAMLDELTKYLLPPGSSPPGELGSWRDEPFREAVLRVALAEALPVSKVTDLIRVPRDRFANDPPPKGEPPTRQPGTWRFGWQRLKQYYDEAATGVTPDFWRQTGEVMADKRLEMITHLDGVRGNDWRVPQRGVQSGLQWCGIFATWCWIKGGVPTRWPWGGPPLGVKKRWMDRKPPPPKPGDMLALKGSLSHHCLLLPDAAGSDEYLVLNGNSDFQSIAINPIKRESVSAIYSLEDFFGPRGR